MMMFPLLDAGDKVYSITPSSMSTGAVTSLPGFRLASDVTLGVRNETAFGTTAKVFGFNSGYLGAGSFTEPLYETTARGRDVVVTTFSFLGSIYLRCDMVTGRAIKIRWSYYNGTGELEVSYASNVPDTYPEFLPGNLIGGTTIFYTDDVDSLVTGWPGLGDTTGDEWEFSLIANTLTVKWNSQTLYETDELWYAMNAGTVLYAPSLSDGAIRDTEITFKASAVTYTDHDNKILDFRDYGWKALSTTGSMSAGSFTLNVASAAGFAIGDRIIVGIGGEAGLGLKGTIGVGGTWPRDRYANAAALPDAATYRATENVGDCFVWVEDVQSVYINFLSPAATWGEWTDYVLSDPIRARGFWHTTNLLPKALKATITNIVGNTITLDTASDAATTDAEVWYDNTWIVPYLMPNLRFEYAANNAISNDGWNIRWQSGTFALSGNLRFPYSNSWTFKGQGRTDTIFYAPKGSAFTSLQFTGNYPTVSDFKVHNWAGKEYFGYDEEAAYPNVGPMAVSISATYADGGLIERVDFLNTVGGPYMGTRFGALVRDCHAVQTNGNLQQYGSWFFQHSYCVDTWYEDCTYTATEIGTAFEIFQADGGGFRRCESTQGVWASNYSGGDYLIEDPVLTLDMSVRPTENDWIDTSLPAININTNIGDGAHNPGIVTAGGSITNPTITIFPTLDGNFGQGGINVNGNGTSNVRVIGTHPTKPGQGVITMEGWIPGDAGRGALGVSFNTTGTGHVVRGIRVIGAAEGANFSNIFAYQSDVVIEDNVADTIAKNDGSSNVSQLGTNGNITNAAYEAL